MKTLPQMAVDIESRHMHVQSILRGLSLQHGYTGKISKEDAADFGKIVVELEDDLEIVIKAVNQLAGISQEGEPNAQSN